MSKKERIKQYLLSGKSLTTGQARSRYGIQNVSARIDELRNHDGYAIITQRTAQGTAKYSIPRAYL